MQEDGSLSVKISETPIPAGFNENGWRYYHMATWTRLVEDAKDEENDKEEMDISEPYNIKDQIGGYKKTEEEFKA